MQIDSDYVHSERRQHRSIMCSFMYKGVKTINESKEIIIMKDRMASVLGDGEGSEGRVTRDGTRGGLTEAGNKSIIHLGGNYLIMPALQLFVTLPIAAITSYHKFSGLRYKFIILKVLEVYIQNAWVKVRVLAGLCSFLEGLGGNPFSCIFYFLEAA